MKKLRLLTTTLFSAVIFAGTGLGARALAVDVLDPVCSQDNRPAVCNDERANSGENPLFGPNGGIARGIDIFTVVAGIAAVIMLIVSGLQYLISSGDPARVSTAKNTLLFAIIGIVIVLFAQIIVNFVVGRI